MSRWRILKVVRFYSLIRNVEDLINLPLFCVNNALFQISDQYNVPNLSLQFLCDLHVIANVTQPRSQDLSSSWERGWCGLAYTFGFVFFRTTAYFSTQSIHGCTWWHGHIENEFYQSVHSNSYGNTCHQYCQVLNKTPKALLFCSQKKLVSRADLSYVFYEFKKIERLK